MQTGDDMRKVLIELIVVDAIAEVAVAVAVGVKRCVGRRKDRKVDRVLRQRIQQFYAVAVRQRPVLALRLIQDIHF